MAQKRANSSDPMKALRAFALGYPEAQEGVACEGTALEKRTIKARNKAFVFLGVADMMVKLSDSLAEAEKLASKEPVRYKVGAHGWVTVTWKGGAPPLLDVLERWIDESYRVVVDKRLVAMLPEWGLPAAKKKR